MNNNLKFLILGAGPAGLTFANKLHQMGEDSFLLIEKENIAGGLCRSIGVDGSPLDIGGGHFLDVKRPIVNRFLFEFMPLEEWNKFDRISKIDINGDLIDHPLEANIWQMKIDDQIEYLKSIAEAGCNRGVDKPQEFVKWIYWKLGNRIANDYMLPYNKKMFGNQLDYLGTYWLDKLPNVSWEETLKSCLLRKSFGTEPGHKSFYYPKKYGYGELWRRLSESIKEHIVMDSPVRILDLNQHMVIVANGDKYFANTIITTIPWNEFEEIKGMPKALSNTIKELKSSSIQVSYHGENIRTDAHWIYYPNIKISHHRSLIRHNFCENSKGYWIETNCNSVQNKNIDKFSFINKYAYPLNTIKKREIMEELLDFAAKRNVYGLGRWGEHMHYNSDVVVERALKLCESLSQNE